MMKGVKGENEGDPLNLMIRIKRGERCSLLSPSL